MIGRMEVGALLLVLALLPLGCSPSEDESGDPNQSTAAQVKQKADKALQASADYLAQQKEKVLEASREKLDTLAQQFNAWVDEIATEDEQVQKELGRLQTRFETAMNQARQAVDKAGELSLEAWQDAKPNLEAALGEAREAYDEFMAFVRALPQESQSEQADEIVEE